MESVTATCINDIIRKRKETQKATTRVSVLNRSRCEAPTAPFVREMMDVVKLFKRNKHAEGHAGTSSWSSRAAKAVAAKGHFLSEEQTVAVVADLIELFRQVIDPTPMPGA